MLRRGAACSSYEVNTQGVVLSEGQWHLSSRAESHSLKPRGRETWAAVCTRDTISTSVRSIRNGVFVNIDGQIASLSMGEAAQRTSTIE